jgi:hypothetical protein
VNDATLSRGEAKCNTGCPTAAYPTNIHDTPRRACTLYTNNKPYHGYKIQNSKLVKRSCASQPGSASGLKIQKVYFVQGDISRLLSLRSVDAYLKNEKQRYCAPEPVSTAYREKHAVTSTVAGINQLSHAPCTCFPRGLCITPVPRAISLK